MTDAERIEELEGEVRRLRDAVERAAARSDMPPMLVAALRRVLAGLWWAP